MKYMIYSSKYEVILNAVTVPGRLGMEECSLGGREAVFSNSLKGMATLKASASDMQALIKPCNTSENQSNLNEK